MIFYRVSFGYCCKNDLENATTTVDNYLAALAKNGQIDKNYTIVPWQKQVIAYINTIGLEADQLKSHSANGKERLKDVEKFFKSSPVWICNEDFPPTQKAIWKNASFLYLYVPYYQQGTPLHRGDNNDAVPLYRVPITDKDREDVYFWQQYYQECDNIWQENSKLTIDAYRMLADPASELSKQGRELCLAIEKATGIPTYYYLMRFFGRKHEEEIQRKCPCCGNSWAVKQPQQQISEPERFCHFYFQCQPCRLVSHLASGNVNLRYAKIGE
ncbi:MAG: Zn-ribbon-containing protein [Planctomycetaceae bacterium]|jgi:predicted  nucleic acid-binding Zn ribbon protein|nr:Zn-ribbon-containing protein [Planctomycetaceae bacterium]